MVVIVDADDNTASSLSSRSVSTSTSLSAASSPSADIEASEAATTPDNKKPRHNCPKYCLICGDPATGYHYEVPSCNGCKTFFRRLVVAGRQFECKIDGKCFDFKAGEKPRRCRSCRYKKCVAVGMNPLAMEVNEDVTKNINYQTIVKKRPTSSPQSPSTSTDIVRSTPVKVQVPNSIVSIACKIVSVIDELTYLEMRTDQFRRSAYNPDPFRCPRLKTMLTSSSIISNANKLGAMPNWPLPADAFPRPPPPGPPDGDFERLPIPPPRHPNSKEWFVYDLLTTVEYAKTFMFFHKLGVEDKIILLKNVALMCHSFMQSFTSFFNDKSDVIVHPDGTSPPSPFKPGTMDDRLFRESTSKVIEPIRRYGISKVEYICTKAIVLCNPAIPGLSPFAQEIIAPEREKYSTALFQHCMANRGSVGGPSQYSALMGVIDTLEHLQKVHKDRYLFTKASNHKMPTNEFVDDVFL